MPCGDSINNTTNIKLMKYLDEQGLLQCQSIRCRANEKKLFKQPIPAVDQNSKAPRSALMQHSIWILLGIAMQELRTCF